MNKIRYFFIIFIILLFILVPGPGTGKIVKNIAVPDGYSRIKYSVDSYSHWIQNLPLKSKKEIRLYDGSIKSPGFYKIFEVVNLAIMFRQDLEQCADFCFRFWAEYHKQKNILNRLYLFNYSGKKKYFKSSNKKYKQFVKWAFVYSNTHSIKKGGKKISESDLRPGDMIVQNRDGGIGHVSVIMDICKSNNDHRLYLIGYSFMPAQEFHIEKADKMNGKQGWFTIEGYYKYLETLFDFGRPVLRRF